MSNKSKYNINYGDLLDKIEKYANVREYEMGGLDKIEKSLPYPIIDKAINDNVSKEDLLESIYGKDNHEKSYIPSYIKNVVVRKLIKERGYELKYLGCKTLVKRYYV